MTIDLCLITYAIYILDSALLKWNDLPSIGNLNETV